MVLIPLEISPIQMHQFGGSDDYTHPTYHQSTPINTNLCNPFTTYNQLMLIATLGSNSLLMKSEMQTPNVLRS